MNQHDRLERSLAALHDEVTFPPSPDIAARIASSLPDRHRMARPGSSRRQWRRYAPFVAAAVVVLVVAIVATIAIPTARESVARWLHVDLPGVRIEVVDPGDVPPHTVPTSLGGSLLLGTPTTLEDAATLAPAPLRMPSDPAVGEPAELWQRDRGAVITMLYPASATLPEIGETGAGLAFMQIVAPNGPILFAKQSIGNDGIEQVRVGGQEGFWVSNGRLVMLPGNPLEIDPSPGSSRWSGNVLIWSDGEGTTFRIESMLDKDDAIRIAESLVPVTAESGNGDAAVTVWEVLETAKPDGMAAGLASPDGGAPCVTVFWPPRWPPCSASLPSPRQSRAAGRLPSSSPLSMPSWPGNRCKSNSASLGTAFPIRYPQQGVRFRSSRRTANRAPW